MTGQLSADLPPPAAASVPCQQGRQGLPRVPSAVDEGPPRDFPKAWMVADAPGIDGEMVNYSGD